MKIEFSEQEVMDMLIDKANAMVGGPAVGNGQFNKVEVKASYNTLYTATVSYEVADEAVEQS
jgi:hypothetical protein